jgi:hypothetical protein
MRVAAPIPTDPKEIAAYWKLYYNMPLGAGTVEEFIANWNRYLTPQPYGPIVDRSDSVTTRAQGA